MIGAISALHYLPPIAPAAAADTTASFADKVTDAVSSVNDAQKKGESALSALASGREVDLHGSMIALEEADIALRTMVSVRDRAIGAYEQLMNTTV
jgi:flagellar hook-basal body complex protein FliE